MEGTALTQAETDSLLTLEVQSLISQYWCWLRDQTRVREIDGWIEITTPYLDRHNDYLQIYARRDQGGWLLTDDGYVIDDLEQFGCDISNPKRRAMLNITLAEYGVQIDNRSLVVRASQGDFALRKHNLVQAMLSVGHMSLQLGASNSCQAPRAEK